jgi:hypothetical protein
MQSKGEASIKEIDAETRRVLASYTGTVTQCPPGVARNKPINPNSDRAHRWLSEHHDDLPVKDAKAERRRLRLESYQRNRIRQRNAAVRANLRSAARSRLCGVDGSVDPGSAPK